MDGLNLENRPHKDEYSSNRHRKKIAALILALIVYLFFMGPLVVDMVPDWWRGPKLHESFFAPDQEKNPPRLAPAPVKYMSAPRTDQQPAPAQPQVQPAQPVMPQEITQEIPEIQEPPKEHIKPEPVKPAPKPEETKPEPTRDTPATIPHAPKKEAQREPLPEEPAPQKMPRKRDRSSRKKWLKESAQEQKVSQPRAAQPKQQQSLVSEISRGLYEHMYYEHAKRESQSFEAAVANSNDNSVKSFELNIFLSKFVKSFCDYSAMNPLFIRADSVPAHIIQFELSFSRKRKISRINFIQESADHRVTTYIKTILSDIVTPQLPSVWKEDEITMRFSIDLTKNLPGDRLSFIPGQF